MVEDWSHTGLESEICRKRELSQNKPITRIRQSTGIFGRYTITEVLNIEVGSKERENLESEYISGRMNFKENIQNLRRVRIRRSLYGNLEDRFSRRKHRRQISSVFRTLIGVDERKKV